MILAALLSLAALGGHGLEIHRVHAVGGGVVLRATVSDPDSDVLTRSTPRLTLDHGEVQEMHARQMFGEDVLTVLAVDQSGSFTTYRVEALDLARTYVESRQEGEAVGVMLFGLSAEELPTSSDDDHLVQALVDATSRPSQPETRLGEFVRQAASRAHAEHPASSGGIRQVVVFTDGGEESSTWSVDEVAQEARHLDVRVHVVAFYRASRGDLASRLDNLSRLADRTGGTYVQVEGESQARQAIQALARSSAASIGVEATVCGLAPGDALSFQNRALLALEVDDGTSLTSEAVPFEHAGLPPCDEPGGASPLGLPAAADGEGGPSTWACLCPALALLLGILGLIGLSIWSGLNRRERDSTATPTATPTSTPTATPTPTPTSTPTPTPTASPRPSPPRAGPPSSEPPPPRPQFPEDLPETHLVGAAGGLLAGQRWRFRARILNVGAEPDNELVADLEQVSGHHARFELYRSGDVYVADLGSTNGTWVQGRRLSAGERALVRPGDRVAISAQVVLELDQPGRTS